MTRNFKDQPREAITSQAVETYLILQGQVPLTDVLADAMETAHYGSNRYLGTPMDPKWFNYFMELAEVKLVSVQETGVDPQG